MIDISHNSGYLDCALVRLDGDEARIYRQLTEHLGASERAQNAIILVGALSKLEKNSKRAQKIRDGFPELVGISYESFNQFLDTL